MPQRLVAGDANDGLNPDVSCTSAAVGDEHRCQNVHDLDSPFTRARNLTAVTIYSTGHQKALHSINPRITNLFPER
jgi:hypothetical protein